MNDVYFDDYEISMIKEIKLNNKKYNIVDGRWRVKGHFDKNFLGICFYHPEYTSIMYSPSTIDLTNPTNDILIFPSTQLKYPHNNTNSNMVKCFNTGFHFNTPIKIHLAKHFSKVVGIIMLFDL